MSESWPFPISQEGTGQNQKVRPSWKKGNIIAEGFSQDEENFPETGVRKKSFARTLFLGGKKERDIWRKKQPRGVGARKELM